jgi:uncharacterized protein
MSVPYLSSLGAVAPDADPRTPGGRLDVLDILRGLAIAGMILVHWHQRIGSEAAGWQDAIAWAVWVLVEQKSWGTFAFLFGVGFAVLLRRLESRGEAVVPIYLRRLAALALFGVIAEVGFGFNVLFQYACWGLVLLAVRSWSTGALLGLAAVAASARPLVAWWTGAMPWAPHASLTEAVATAAKGADYGALVAARWALFLQARIPDTWPELLPDTNLVLFIIGLLALRHRVIEQPKRHLRLISGWMGFGLLAWATWWLGLRHLASGIREAAIASGFGLIQEQWLCFTYMGAVLLLLTYRPWWTERLALFGAAGRTALTNYLLQVAVVDVLASGYGLGLRLSPMRYVVGAGLMFTVQALASRAWVRRHRMGPLEWIWRVITYGRPQPLRSVTPRSVDTPRSRSRG